MNKEGIRAILRAHEPELKAAGLLLLRPSAPRLVATQRPPSDADLLAD